MLTPHTALFLLVLSVPVTHAQDRLSAPITNHKQVALRGTRNPRVNHLSDAGALSPLEPIQGLAFRFKPSAKQKADLERFLEDQQNPVSPSYHKWLTPEEFGDRFSLSSHDYAQISDWLRSQGFQVDSVARSRTFITFSGSAGHVGRTFGADLRRFHVNGKAHFANVVDAQLPAELEPLVSSLTGLDDLPTESLGRVKPLLNLADGRHGIGPGDLATIYNMKPLLDKGFDGSGQKIVVIGKSNPSIADLRAYRDFYKLPQNDPKVILVPGYADPGVNEEFAEAVTDLEIVGGIAPNASITFVYAPSSYIAASYAVDQNIAPVINVSFGGCEKNVLVQPALMSEARAVAQQANAQGITWISSAGDTGVAACEAQFVDTEGVSGIGVLHPASFPEVTAVGGTMFVEGTGNYWGPTSLGTATALSYIPEAAWNETALGPLATSSGGASVFFNRPAWQTGPGIPSGTARLVPDIALAAAWAHDAYVVVVNNKLWAWGGTSAAAPVFSGIITILNQYLVSTGAIPHAGLGNVNPGLYQMARTTTSVFHDITAGDNIVPCKIGTPDCTSGKYGNIATPGWDAVTGLGSIDVNNFVLNWPLDVTTPGVTATSTTLAANPGTIPTGGSTTLTAVVKPASGAALPTGPVYFSLPNKPLGSVGLVPSGAAASATITVKASQLVAGANTITAYYGGASAFLSSTGTATVTVSTPGAPASAVTVSAQPSPVYKQAPDSAGNSWHFTLQLAETAGVATKVTGLSIDGADQSSQIASLFGGTNLPASGTLKAAMHTNVATVPSERTYTFSGVDAGGQRWDRQVKVTFLAEEVAPLSLTNAPSIVRPTVKPAEGCAAGHPLFHVLRLQEMNGVEVRLTKFIADSYDLSDQIQTFFSSLRLAPFGTLVAGLCWEMEDLPVTKTFQVEGVDAVGRTFKANLDVPFKAAAGIPGTLAVSKNQVQLLANGTVPPTASINVTLPGDEAWSVVALPAGRKSAWLNVSPKSGRGPAQLSLSASAEGLSNGVYTARLTVQSEFMTPQFIDVWVTFVVGTPGGATISGAQNAASFKQAYAPGMLMSVYGTKLANSTQSAKALPLPLNLDGVTAEVNGVPAPLWFVSPTQINLQIPYETPTGNVLVVINNNGQVVFNTIQVAPVAPGIFNNAGLITPTSSGARGSNVAIYITGEGELTPMIETGAPPAAGTPISQLPKPLLPVKVTVGGVPAEVTFVGNPWLVGVTQVNFTVPSRAAAGVQPVVVTVGDTASAAQSMTVR